MNRNGRNGHGRRQHLCPVCGRSPTTGQDPGHDVRVRLLLTADGWRLVEGVEGYPVTPDDRGRAKVYLGVPRVRRVRRALKSYACELCDGRIERLDPYKWTLERGRRRVRCSRCRTWPARDAEDRARRLANSGGWQYLYRFLMAWDLGRELGTSEHVHHRNGDRTDNAPGNLELLEAWYHSRYGAYALAIAGWREDLGRFVQRRKPEGPFDWPRLGPILGPEARD